MLSLDGLEMIAVLVVMGLFIKVLEQFGMFEPVGGEGKAMPFPSELFIYLFLKKRELQVTKGMCVQTGECFAATLTTFRRPSSGPGRGAALSDGFGLPVQT